ncbi:MAG: Cell division protein FtsZ [Alphaproteobacteria bacterium MarineAlpha5_Bin9]|nr:MAG: Cell division protein FtsZ [Alphaproteobacteria bacterium MarineAlpha5_Bin9]|tara:strand:+ start:188 stop:1834 length:1647 start_codon:yes stop_codon:yes gene_type:complete
MTINISLPDAGPNLHPKITVMGVGGAGGNAVNNMIKSNLEGVDFIIANTDAQALENSNCERKIQLGLTITRGLGAGMRPDIGRKAAEESFEEIKSKFEGSHMIFIAAGMGGGTGTGAAPIIAQLARECGILTVGVVTKPFHFEGSQKMKLANEGIDSLQQHVDTLISIPNQNLFRIANEKTTFADAFKMADDVLYAGVRGVTDLMVQPGLINLDFSDIKTVMSEMGKAMMGTGQSEHEEQRAVKAAEAAIASPLIDDVSLSGAKGLIINITGGKDLTLYEVDEAANRIKQEIREDANIIYGTTCDDRLEGKVRVSIVATGIDVNNSIQKPSPINSDNLSFNNAVYSHQNSINDNHLLINEEGKIDENKVTNETNSENNIHFSESLHDSHDQEQEKIISSELFEKESNHESLSENHLNVHENNFESNQDDQKIEEENNDEERMEISDHSDAKQDQDDKIAVRKLSLFDTLEEKNEAQESKKDDENILKNEPILEKNDIDEQQESINENFSDNNFKHTDFVDEEGSESDLNQDQEEELLDIPTFLRRQAN